MGEGADREKSGGELWPLIANVGMHCGRVLRKIWTR